MAVGEAHVFTGFLIPVLTQSSFQSHQPLISHASAEVKGENMQERNFYTTGCRTHNHQIMSPTCSPLIHPDGGNICETYLNLKHNTGKHRPLYLCLYVDLVYNFKDKLTHYHTMQHFVTQEIYSCGKHCEKRRNCF